MMKFCWISGSRYCLKILVLYGTTALLCSYYCVSAYHNTHGLCVLLKLIQQNWWRTSSCHHSGEPPDQSIQQHTKPCNGPKKPSLSAFVANKIITFRRKSVDLWNLEMVLQLKVPGGCFLAHYHTDHIPCFQPCQVLPHYPIALFLHRPSRVAGFRFLRIFIILKFIYKMALLFIISYRIISWRTRRCQDIHTKEVPVVPRTRLMKLLMISWEPNQHEIQFVGFLNIFKEWQWGKGYVEHKTEQNIAVTEISSRIDAKRLALDRQLSKICLLGDVCRKSVVIMIIFFSFVCSLQTWTRDYAKPVI